MRNSFGQRRIKKHPRREKLIEQGKQCSFYGETVGSFDKEDLFMMIGYLMELKIKDAERLREEWELGLPSEGPHPSEALIGPGSQDR